MVCQQDAAQLVAEIMALQRRGFTPAQCRHLLALRGRACRGDYREDGLGSVAGDLGFDRRLAFARWLYQRGRIGG